MKRFLVLLFTLLLCNSAFAYQYKFDDPKMIVDIPNGYIVSTKNYINPDSYALINMSRSQYVSFMNQRNIILNALNAAKGTEINIVYTQNQGSIKTQDYSYLPNPLPAHFLNDLKQSFNRTGNFNVSRVYEKGDSYPRFVVVDAKGNDQGNITDNKMYLTVFDKHSMGINGVAYSGNVAALNSDLNYIVNRLQIIGHTASVAPSNPKSSTNTATTVPKLQNTSSNTIATNTVQNTSNNVTATNTVQTTSTSSRSKRDVGERVIGKVVFTLILFLGYGIYQYFKKKK